MQSVKLSTMVLFLSVVMSAESIARERFKSSTHSASVIVKNSASIRQLQPIRLNSMSLEIDQTLIPVVDVSNSDGLAVSVSSVIAVKRIYTHSEDNSVEYTHSQSKPDDYAFYRVVMTPFDGLTDNVMKPSTMTVNNGTQYTLQLHSTDVTLTSQQSKSRVPINTIVFTVDY